jgi:glycosyltransferase involved in cell wall biosynthesis
MHIMQICSGTLVNGAIIHAVLLSRELAARGHRVTMVCRPGSWIGEQLSADPVEIVRSDLHRWPPGELRRLAALVRQQGVDVIHSHMSSAHFFGILLRWMTGTPCVATAQSRHFQLHWMFNDCVIAVSEATREYHCRHNFVRRSRSETIHNFIDYQRLQQVPADARRRVRESLGISQGAMLVGAIGDVFPRKGQIHLVEAMPSILDAVPNAHLLVVGPPKDPRYAAAVRDRAAALGVEHAITWAGERNDVAELIAAMDLKVLASLEESLPLSILEAMAAGLPVVATTAGGIPECVRHGQTGLLVPPADSRSLASAIVRLLGNADLRRQYGEAARQRIVEHFSAESHTSSLETVFARLITRRRPAQVQNSPARAAAASRPSQSMPSGPLAHPRAIGH